MNERRRDAAGINMSQALNVLFKFKNVIHQNNIPNLYLCEHIIIICNTQVVGPNNKSRYRE